jgi:hypothetical protein
VKTEKDPEQTDDKRVYRRPQLSVLGPITRTTLSNKKGEVLDNPNQPGFLGDNPPNVS